MSGVDTRPAPAAPFNPYRHIRGAAAGCLEDQRTLTEAGFEAFLEQDAIKLVECLVFARMAAAQGDITDTGRLLALLSLAGEMFEGEEALTDLTATLAGEALALVSLLADQGVELAGDMLPAISDNTPPQAALIAKSIRAAMVQ